MFKSELIVSDCVLKDLRTRDDYENNKKVGVKNVVSIFFMGDKPLVCSVPEDKVLFVKQHLGKLGAVRILQDSSHEKQSWSSADGRSGVSDILISKNWVFKAFAIDPESK